jgi:hypothetical protein
MKNSLTNSVIFIFSLIYLLTLEKKKYWRFVNSKTPIYCASLSVTVTAEFLYGCDITVDTLYHEIRWVGCGMPLDVRKSNLVS